MTLDLQGSGKVNDNFRISLTALNLFDRVPTIDIVTYEAHPYNPVQGGTAIYDRNFKIAAKVNF